ncbi:MAG TPA: hypothetical protein PKK94_27985, partial [Leptospiraceae bacterium]|nr:hypothetical protein [Leptospiraceae bacterium]
LANLSQEKVRFGQIGGLFNRAKFTPVQIAAFGNHVFDEAYFQFAGGFNMVTQSMRNAPFSRGRDPYAQLSLFFNLSGHTWVQAAAFNIDDTFNYVQLGAVNYAKEGHFEAGGINISMRMQGVQVGGANFSENMSGVQLGAVNMGGKSRGISVGFWNMYEKKSGLSVGVFNYAKHLYGVQIGLLNVNEQGSVPVSLGINAGMKD